MKKKVLIICDLFPPAFGPRMGYLCKYLNNSEWQPVVLTEAMDDSTFSFLEGYCPVTYVDFYPSKQPLIHRLQWLFTFLTGNKERKMYRKAKELVTKNDFSLILCSTYRTFPLTTAARIAKEQHLPLVTDLRDIIEQYSGTEFIARPLPKLFGLEKWIAGCFKRRSLKERNKALRQAACVTTVSPWHVETLKAYNPNVQLIYNGFDPELFFPERKTTQQFTITYTGRVLSTAMRDPSLLLEALALLHKNGRLSAEECRVKWYVDDASRRIIEQEAENAGVSSFMDFENYIPAAKIPSVLNNSSILLLLTNRSAGDGPKGIMTTKFFEALAVERPILCVRSDESYLEAALSQSKAGVAARQKEEVVCFLEKYYKEWKEKGYTTSETDRNILKNYSREGQARQFIHIFETLTNN